MSDQIPSFKQIDNAHQRISTLINKTPVVTSKTIDRLANASLYFKCENFQKVGAFKARGGMNAVFSIDKSTLTSGVATHSSGNHAQAVALAAATANIPAYIVMPSNAPEVKKSAVKGYGAKVIECEPTLQAREETLQVVIKETGATFIHPYNDYRIIAGQATAAKELIEETTEPFDYILAPVGGGGLLSGTALAAHYMSPTTKVIGCEPTGADDAYRSFQTKKLVPQTGPDTICDGLLTSLGAKPFEIIMKYVSDILVADDQQILQAMRLVWERMKLVIEPSSAVPLAVVLNNKGLFPQKKIGIIISGGNVDLGVYFGHLQKISAGK